MVAVISSATGNTYSWNAQCQGRRFKVSLISTTDPAKWEMKVHSTSNYSDPRLAQRNKYVGRFFRSAPSAIRKELGLSGVHSGYARFAEPAKFPLVEVLLDKTSDMFASKQSWCNELSEAAWGNLMAEARKSVIQPNAYVFVPDQGMKRPKAPPRIQPSFETASGINGSKIEFRWLPLRSRRRMAEAWIKIDRFRTEHDESAFVSVGFDCDNDLGVTQSWLCNRFFSIPRMESGAERLGRTASTKSSTTFQGEASDIKLLIDTLRRFAEFAKEQGVMADQVEKPLAEFIALAESDELDAVTLQAEAPADPGRKPRRRGVL